MKRPGDEYRGDRGGNNHERLRGNTPAALCARTLGAWVLKGHTAVCPFVREAASGTSGTKFALARI